MLRFETKKMHKTLKFIGTYFGIIVSCFIYGLLRKKVEKKVYTDENGAIVEQLTCLKALVGLLRFIWFLIALGKWLFNGFKNLK